MNVGWIGLGKLGFPCAMVLAQHHQVFGYDVDERPWDILAGLVEPMREEGLEELLNEPRHGKFVHRCDDIARVVDRSDIVFVAVQTPHEARFGGEQPMPAEERADFEYSYLVQACRDVCFAAATLEKPITLVVVSTVLPGTCNRLIRPLLNHYVQLVYSPQFIAMGTTIADFSNPEFVICGSDGGGVRMLGEVFTPVHGRNLLFTCDITTAEMIKVLYNTYISMKIVWANHLMELSHKLGADCSQVVQALSSATDRVISSKYLEGGMGDGGACHPRDLIAMSWLEQQLGASFPLFENLAYAREMQTEWLAELVRRQATLTGHQVVILGKAYKPESDLTAGSPALLLRSYLEDLHPWQWDPVVQSSAAQMFLRDGPPFVYVVATKHEEFAKFAYRTGSVVIDPFGYVYDRPGVTVIRVGRR